MLFELGLNINTFLPVFLVAYHDLKIGIVFFVVAERFHQLLYTAFVIG
jgi:hypothetical protein